MYSISPWKQAGLMRVSVIGRCVCRLHRTVIVNGFLSLMEVTLAVGVQIVRPPSVEVTGSQRSEKSK